MYILTVSRRTVGQECFTFCGSETWAVRKRDICMKVETLKRILEDCRNKHRRIKEGRKTSTGVKRIGITITLP